jgi:uncharacterized phosphosugar-binding protein
MKRFYARLALIRNDVFLFLPNSQRSLHGVLMENGSAGKGATIAVDDGVSDTSSTDERHMNSVQMTYDCEIYSIT